MTNTFLCALDPSRFSGSILPSRALLPKIISSSQSKISIKKGTSKYRFRERVRQRRAHCNNNLGLVLSRATKRGLGGIGRSVWQCLARRAIESCLVAEVHFHYWVHTILATDPTSPLLDHHREESPVTTTGLSSRSRLDPLSKVTVPSLAT